MRAHSRTCEHNSNAKITNPWHAGNGILRAKNVKEADNKHVAMTALLFFSAG